MIGGGYWNTDEFINKMFCLDLMNVAIEPGVDIDEQNIRICLPYMNVQVEIGDLTPDVHPPDFLREARTGDQLFTPDGTPLLVAGP